MKRFLFKRQLIILASIIAALCIVIPVATFAKGTPPGEQKRTSIHAAIATAGTPTSIVADCSSPQLLTTLNKGDVFNASATLTSTDPNEQSEGEFLHILDASTTPATNLLTIDNNTGSGKVTFTAKVASDPIQACIVGIDTDETGTVTFTVTPAEQLPTTITLTPKQVHEILARLGKDALCIIKILASKGASGSCAVKSGNDYDMQLLCAINRALNGGHNSPEFDFCPPPPEVPTA